MTYLVTGSSGHLGEALMRVCEQVGRPAIGLDIKPGLFTSQIGDLADSSFVESCFEGVSAVFHTATLHKPHVATHAKQAFIDTNITGTLNLLETCKSTGVRDFVFTSTTSTFGDALGPPPHEPTAWITEDVVPIPKNIYGITKIAAENLCQLFHRNHGMNSVVLRTSRFFPEDDDSKATRDRYQSLNAKVNELLYRRVDIEDVVSAHLCALGKAAAIGFGRYIISATSPFAQSELKALRENAAEVVCQYTDFREIYAELGWEMFPSLDRVYVNDKARADLDWEPKFTFAHAIERLRSKQSPFSDLVDLVGIKGYHDQVFEDEPFPVE